MEQARISSPQGTQAPQAARARQGSDGVGAAASPAGFLALLSALDQVEVQGTGLTDLAGETVGSGADLLDGGQGATSGVADASAVAAWQGLLAPDTSAVEAWQGLLAPDASAVTAGQGLMAHRLSVLGQAERRARTKRPAGKAAARAWARY